MTHATVLASLYALRAQLELTILLLETGVEAPPSDGTCAHPDGRQVNASTMGEPPKVLCLDCGQERLGTLER